ncbi:hypothetical protein C8Q77DRAFT_1075826 [Trametes polyzona]|nr:hypothetical protein C8Q77DRAFT_1075825 [Trametes polyzona]KAI0629879.1 hypothetical protein C8Q77DRAFT_1075826 [Trametes polyzona]
MRIIRALNTATVFHEVIYYMYGLIELVLTNHLRDTSWHYREALHIIRHIDPSLEPPANLYADYLLFLNQHIITTLAWIGGHSYHDPEYVAGVAWLQALNQALE